MSKIAVIGATGNIGSAAVRELLLRGESPLCLVRDPDKARQVLGKDANLVLANLDDASTLDAPLSQVDRVFLVTGRALNAEVQQINVIKAARRAGVKFVLKVSGAQSVVGPRIQSVLGRAHHAAERALLESGVDGCILRPGAFMQNIFDQAASIKAKGTVSLPHSKHLRVSFTDTRDAGALAARVLQQPDAYTGQTLEFTGPQTTYEEFARDLAEALGAPVTYVECSLAATAAAMRAQNLPEWLVEHNLTVLKTISSGGFTPERTDPIRAILGRAPSTTREFARDYASLFR